MVDKHSQFLPLINEGAAEHRGGIHASHPADPGSNLNAAKIFLSELTKHSMLSTSWQKGTSISWYWVRIPPWDEFHRTTCQTRKSESTKDQKEPISKETKRSKRKEISSEASFSRAFEIWQLFLYQLTTKAEALQFIIIFIPFDTEAVKKEREREKA